MAIEVRIPTILRNYTGGAKSVQGAGTTLDELLVNLDAEHGGLRERLIDGESLRRFVNVYLNDEDVRFLGGLKTPVADGDTVTVLPAVAGGSYPLKTLFILNGSVSMRYDSLLDSLGNTPLVGLPGMSPARRRPAVGQARGPQPHRVGEGPRGVLHGASRRRRTACSSPARRSWSRPRGTPASRWPWSPSSAATS